LLVSTFRSPTPAEHRTALRHLLLVLDAAEFAEDQLAQRDGDLLFRHGDVLFGALARR